MMWLAVVALFAQSAQAPPPQTPQEPGTIRGQVTDSVTGLPLKQVRIELAAVPRTIEGSRRTQSDAQGRYRFEGLPPARYTIQFQKARYVPVQYGQRQPGTNGKQLDLLAGRTEMADAAMWRASAIVGHVVDDLGEPVENATVSVARWGYIRGARGLVFGAASALTNDAGEYRIPGLSPGEYFVVATERSDGFGTDAEADIGFFRTMHPSATVPAQARAVAVRAGQDTTGIDVALLPARTATLSGRVMTAEGQPAPRVAIQLEPLDSVLGGVGGSTTTQADGSFSFPRLLPGAYEIHARQGGGVGRAADEFQAAILPVTIAGADIVDLPVPMTHGAHVTGRVVPPAGAVLPTSVNIFPLPVTSTIPFGLPLPTGVQTDGAIDWKGLVGPRLVQAGGLLPKGWRIASVMHGSDDIIDTPTLFKDTDEITITLSDDAASVEGTATGADGKPADEYTAILFSDDPSKWKLLSRFLKTAVPGTAKGFSFDAMPPGRYYIAAVEGLAPGQYLDPEFLERLKARATSTTLERGAQPPIVLRVVKP